MRSGRQPPGSYIRGKFLDFAVVFGFGIVVIVAFGLGIVVDAVFDAGSDIGATFGIRVRVAGWRQQQRVPQRWA